MEKDGIIAHGKMKKKKNKSSPQEAGIQLKAGIQRRKLREKPWRNGIYWLAFYSFLSLVFHMLKTISLGMQLPTWARMQQLSPKKMCDEGSSSVVVPSSQVIDSRCVQVKSKATYGSMALPTFATCMWYQ